MQSSSQLETAIVGAVAEKALNEVLRRLGYSTQKAKGMYKKSLIKDGEIKFTGDAGEVWEWLKKTGQVTSRFCKAP